MHTAGDLKRYDLRFSGRMERNLDEAKIGSLLRAGAIDSRTDCRVAGSERWLTINDHLPLLKWGIGLLEDGPATHSKRTDLSAPAAMVWTRTRLLLLIFAVAIASGSLVYFAQSLWPLLERSPASSRTAAVRQMPDIRPVSYPPRKANVAALRSERPPSVPIAVPVRPPASNQYVATQAAAAQARPAYKAQPAPPEEVTIPLQRWTHVTTRFGSFSVEIIDHGPVTFSVRINDFRFRRLDKVKGFETTGTNITLIHQLPGADVYFIDRISVSVGFCVLKIVPRS